jgi:hypothetical protein
VARQHHVQHVVVLQHNHPAGRGTGSAGQQAAMKERSRDTDQGRTHCRPAAAGKTRTRQWAASGCCRTPLQAGSVGRASPHRLPGDPPLAARETAPLVAHKHTLPASSCPTPPHTPLCVLNHCAGITGHPRLQRAPPVAFIVLVPQAGDAGTPAQLETPHSSSSTTHAASHEQSVWLEERNTATCLQPDLRPQVACCLHHAVAAAALDHP